MEWWYDKFRLYNKVEWMLIKTLFIENINWKAKETLWYGWEREWNNINGQQSQGKWKINTGTEILKWEIRDDLSFTNKRG